MLKQFCIRLIYFLLFYLKEKQNHKSQGRRNLNEFSITSILHVRANNILFLTKQRNGFLWIQKMIEKDDNLKCKYFSKMQETYIHILLTFVENEARIKIPYCYYHKLFAIKIIAGIQCNHSPNKAKRNTSNQNRCNRYLSLKAGKL